LAAASWRACVRYNYNDTDEPLEERVGKYAREHMIIKDDVDNDGPGYD
jgi:hypothetical protein